jgi:hypothetical protein
MRFTRSLHLGQASTTKEETSDQPCKASVMWKPTINSPNTEQMTAIQPNRLERDRCTDQAHVVIQTRKDRQERVGETGQEHMGKGCVVEGPRIDIAIAVQLCIECFPNELGKPDGCRQSRSFIMLFQNSVRSPSVERTPRDYEETVPTFSQR